ncbi:MAG: C45 family peptidase [Prevotellaceae bacterium]|jgi:predicted choloylglycine hydrolase|nr:C45 family peptidase [Prevotellaceae bacterium]
MKDKKRFWKKFCIILLAVAAALVIAGYALDACLHVAAPAVPPAAVSEQDAVCNQNFVAFEGSRLRHSESGLWEMYLEGEAFERGVAAGKMAKDLLKYQEDAFVAQIRRMIPSDAYLKFLRLFIAFFNRHLPDYVPEEYKQEIYGISLSCTDAYNMIGTPYERQLNYHSAHDLGHALQDYMLVGCTSFAGWNGSVKDSLLLVGRNFDFYVGEQFAENKIVAFYNPAKGYKFAMVTWAGMTGVLSGMNEQGLTVTINAAKSSVPTSAATPISILCREILQYAANIEDACAIAGQRKTFVSESILIGSAADNRAVIIEKSPEKTGLYQSGKDWLVCANHYQSDAFKDDERNTENIATSDSPYRQRRAEELIGQHIPLDPLKAALILRDQKGPGGEDIGVGNERSINQLIAHHSVIFLPQKGLMWVSTAPWQLGKYVAYNLPEIFANPDFSREIKTGSLTIPEDPFLYSDTYKEFIRNKTTSHE